MFLSGILVGYCFDMSTFTDIKERVQTLIPELTNTSNASIWTRLCQCFAGVIDTTVLNCANSELVIANSARSLRVAGRQYYIDTALAYQYGDNLVLLDPKTYRYGYAETDTSKQIVKQVALLYDVTNRVIIISVATIDNDGVVTPLTSAQLADFKSYMEYKTPLGLAPEITSTAAWTIDAEILTIRYDSAYSLESIKKSVQAVLKNQQAKVRGFVPIYVNEIESALNDIDGVIDAYFTAPVAVSPDASVSRAVVKGVLNTDSGYFNFSDGLRDLTKVEFVIA